MTGLSEIAPDIIKPRNSIQFLGFFIAILKYGVYEEFLPKGRMRMERLIKQLNVSALLVSSLLSALLLSGSACKANTENVMGHYTASEATDSSAVVPYISPAYYQCIEVLPVDLENTYYTAYGNHAEAETMYNGKVFVFKNQLVDLFMIRELDKGWVWADLVKCPVINLDAAKKLKPGDRVDIVGVCLGRDLKISPGLYFSDCYILPTGSVQLPAPGGGGAFAPVY
jgi:hypothetical protein